MADKMIEYSEDMDVLFGQSQSEVNKLNYEIEENEENN
jgi:hypothetical protein